MVNSTIARLLCDQNKVYYGVFLNMCRKIPNPNLSAVAGVNITDGVNLYYNPGLWETLPLKEQEAVLEHEVLHLVMNHCIPERGAGRNHQLWNIACDLEINQFINGLPSFACTVDKFKLKSGETAEYYYDKLKLMAEKGKQLGKEMDDHSKWESGVSAETARNIVYNVAQTAKNAAGSLPGDLEQVLAKLGNTRVNWREQLKQFVFSSVTANRRKTRKRTNRRYGLLTPGKRKDSEAHLAVCMDVSGSVADASIQQYFAELGAMCKVANVKLTIIEADAAVTQVYEYNPNKPIKIVGRGGTAYQPALDEATKLGVDGAIYFGDMDTADTPKQPEYPVLWATVQGGKPPVNWGKQVVVA